MCFCYWLPLNVSAWLSLEHGNILHIFRYWFSAYRKETIFRRNVKVKLKFFPNPKWDLSNCRNSSWRTHGNWLRQVFGRNIRLLGFAFSCWPKHVQWLAHSQRLETTGSGKNQRCLGINSPECTCECQFDWCDRWIGEKSFVTFPTLIIVENIDQLKTIRYSSNSTWFYIYSKIRCRLKLFGQKEPLQSSKVSWDGGWLVRWS